MEKAPHLGIKSRCYHSQIDDRIFILMINTANNIIDTYDRGLFASRLQRAGQPPSSRYTARTPYA